MVDGGQKERSERISAGESDVEAMSKSYKNGIKFELSIKNDSQA